ncbi:MAG: hypothetical protein ACK4RV_00460 [Caulobacter sp.]
MESDPLLYPQGLDVLWLAADRKGRLASFASAGRGPVPKSQIEGFDDWDDLFAWLDVRSDQEYSVDSEMVYEEARSFAAKGLYVYDWSDIHRTAAIGLGYERLCRPAEPVLLHALPPNLARIPISQLDVDFDDAPWVDPSGLVACLSLT